MSWRKEIGMLSRSMHRLARGPLGRITAALIGAVVVSAVATPAFAAEVRQGDNIVVGANETINDDLYAFGSTVTILGTVNGDVFAAGGTTTISGQVRQS